MNNLLAAIRAKLGELRNLAGTIAGIIGGFLHHSVPDEGPLKDDDKWGGEFVDNLINGMQSRISSLQTAARMVASTMSGQFTTPNTAAQSGVGAGAGVVVIPITLDGKQIATYTIDIVNQQVRQSGASRLAR
jgi:hypothetical protein